MSTKQDKPVATEPVQPVRKTQPVATPAYNMYFAALNGVSDFKNNLYSGTMSFANELNAKLTKWVENLKGKSDNPDEYFPRDNYMIIHKLDLKSKSTVLKLAKLGAKLRDTDKDKEAQKMKYTSEVKTLLANA